MERENIEFSDEEKCKYFDEIVKHFYQKNFGSFSKTDMDILMFHIYIDNLIKNARRSDNTIDYARCSDYVISRQLGITQQRVRSLKVRAQLAYPIDYQWKKSLATLTKHARYDKNTKMITLNIPDPNLYLEIRNFIESRGDYVEVTLNNKILRLRVEYYIDLLLELDENINRKYVIKQLRDKFSKDKKQDIDLERDSIAKTLLNLSKQGTEISSIILQLLKIISPNFVHTALSALQGMFSV
jgi:hypothetical protein